ncbi:MAG: Holliday junction resolvase RuvX [Verrucomicrobiota bacterium]
MDDTGLTVNSPSPQRFLAIDHGDARIGLAVSDDLNLLAHPLETIHVRVTPDPLARIAQIIVDRHITTLVVGLPIRMDGSEGTAAEKVRRFTEKLANTLPKNFPIRFVDEYYSTATAREHLRASGRSARQSKNIIDQAAACVILQDHLDSLAP